MGTHRSCSASKLLSWSSSCQHQGDGAERDSFQPVRVGLQRCGAGLCTGTSPSAVKAHLFPFLLPSFLSICLAEPGNQASTNSLKYRDAFTHCTSIGMHLHMAHSCVRGDATEPHMRGYGDTVGTGLALPAAVTCLNALLTLAK